MWATVLDFSNFELWKQLCPCGLSAFSPGWRGVPHSISQPCPDLHKEPAKGGGVLRMRDDWKFCFPLNGLCAQGFCPSVACSLAFCTHHAKPHPRVRGESDSYVCPPIIWGSSLEKGLGLPFGTPSPTQNLAHSEYWAHHKSELGFLSFSWLFFPPFT